MRWRASARGRAFVAPGIELRVAVGVALLATGCLAPAPPQAGSPEPERLLESTDRILTFLRGDAALDTTLLADSVTLYIAPEGGGVSRWVSSRELRDRRAWRVGAHVLAPPPGPGIVTRRVGRHFNCMDYPLASRFEDLARLPHVGVKIEPRRAESCLQSWNLTFVFLSGTTPPILTAVVYDQWEW